MGNVLKRYPGLTANVYHYFLEVLAGQMMSDGKLSDPAKSIHTKLQF